MKQSLILFITLSLFAGSLMAYASKGLENAKAYFSQEEIETISKQIQRYKNTKNRFEKEIILSRFLDAIRNTRHDASILLNAEMNELLDAAENEIQSIRHANKFEKDDEEQKLIGNFERHFEMKGPSKSDSLLSLTLYPNPVQLGSSDLTTLNISMQEDCKNARVIILNSSGQRAITEDLLNETPTGRNLSIKVNTAALAPGIYFVKVLAQGCGDIESSTQTLKLLVI